ncbi:MAG: hypothetical protein HYV97_11100 [Bdellovibrio sp.]|nr:hypothetical protein [Bdellovibrio sp.]
MIVVVSGVIWIFYDGEDNSVSFSQYREVQKEITISPQRSVDLQVSKRAIEEKPAAKVPSAISTHQFDQAMILAGQANKRCEGAFRKLLPHNKWPEPFGPSYTQIQDLRALLTVGLSPSLAKEDHQVILAMGAELAGEHLMPAERVQKLLRTFWELESCRGRDMATLLDTILELARKNKTLKKYQDAEIRGLLAQLWQALVSAQRGYYTPTDLTFLSGFWMKAQAQGLIGGAHRGDLVGLVEKMTSELHEEEARLPRSGIPLTSQKFLEFYREVQALGHELEEFGKEVLSDRLDR